MHLVAPFTNRVVEWPLPSAQKVELSTIRRITLWTSTSTPTCLGVGVMRFGDGGKGLESRGHGLRV